jgi:hypothetical protein
MNSLLSNIQITIIVLCIVIIVLLLVWLTWVLNDKSSCTNMENLSPVEIGELIQIKGTLNDEKLLYNPKWSKYRISDVVRIGKKNDIEYHIKNFKNTLVHQYIISHKKKYPTSNYGRSNTNLILNPLYTNYNNKKSFKVSIKDIKLLKSLVDNMFNMYRSTISEIIGKDPTTINTVHLRIGDILDPDSPDYLRKDWYVHPESFRSYAKYFKKKGEKVVYLLGGIHTEKVDASYSIEYIKEVRKIFKEYGIDTIFLKGTPDLDICIMTYSKNYIKSGGGFSNLIVKLRNPDYISKCRWYY